MKEFPDCSIGLIKSDCIYHFPIDWEPTEFPVWFQINQKTVDTIGFRLLQQIINNEIIPVINKGSPVELSPKKNYNFLKFLKNNTN